MREGVREGQKTRRVCPPLFWSAMKFKIGDSSTGHRGFRRTTQIGRHRVCNDVLCRRSMYNQLFFRVLSNRRQITPIGTLLGGIYTDWVHRVYCTCTQNDDTKIDYTPFRKGLRRDRIQTRYIRDIRLRIF